MKISQLKGLGQKSELMLKEVGIETAEDLKTVGAVPAFIRLQEHKKHTETGSNRSHNLSINMLYALVGAIENEHWLSIAKHERARLLTELDGYQSLKLEFERDQKH